MEIVPESVKIQNTDGTGGGGGDIAGGGGPVEVEGPGSTKTLLLSGYKEPHDGLNDKVILDNLFRLCDFKELSVARLVCKQWHEGSLPAWCHRAPRQHLRLPIHGRCSSGSTDNYRSHYASESLYMLEFLNKFHNFHPSTSYDYAGLRKCSKFRLEGCAERHSLQTFFWSAGPWITELEVGVTLHDWDTYRDLLLSRFTPNLVRLKAELRVVVGSRKHDVGGAGGKPLPEMYGDQDVHPDWLDEQQGPHKELKSLQISLPFRDNPGIGILEVDTWIQLFQRYPKLQSLTRGHWSPRHEESGVGNMLEAMRRTGVRLDHLTHFQLHFGRKDDIWDSAWTTDTHPLLAIFRDTPLLLLRRLKEFGISFGNTKPLLLRNSSILDEMFRLLAQEGSTLKRLMLGADEPNKNNFLQSWLVVLPSVEELELSGAPFQRLSFLKHFPNLKSLVGGRSDDDDVDDFIAFLPNRDLPLYSSIREEELAGVVIPTLTKFRIYYSDCFSPEDIRVMREVMPHLKDLTLALDNESFRMTCQCWPSSLEELHVVGDRLNDEGITGLVGVDRGAGEEERNPQNITALVNLKCLRMSNRMDYWGNGQVGPYPVGISEKSVFRGFLELASLKTLEIAVRPKIATAVEGPLKDRIDEVVIHVVTWPCHGLDSGEGCNEDCTISGRIE